MLFKGRHCLRQPVPPFTAGASCRRSRQEAAPMAGPLRLLVNARMGYSRSARGVLVLPDVSDRLLAAVGNPRAAGAGRG